ncbi:MAG: class I tRNA ligase family protein [Minisyncoccia bacterium]|jgi:isoleucyl-tRNA synthetase
MAQKRNSSDDNSSLPRREEKTLEFWDAHRVFEKSLEKTKEGKPFTFYDGPPFATGLPHYGHILASTIKDVVPRYQTMNGRFVRRRWGWDCHGLPIEEIVERKLGISGKKQIEAIGIKKFNETCRSMVLEYAAEWKKMIRRIARWVEFDDSYKTMDASYMESVWWAFKEIYKKKLVYEGRKVLLYCPRCETPISNFEVAMDNSYKDVTEESVTVKFHLKPGQKFGKGGNYETKDNAYILSWTTTPWTLPGNVALAVGEDVSYTALRVKNVPGLYILASDRANTVFKDQPVEVVHDDIKGKDLVGLEYEPLFDVPAARNDKAFKVYPADFVTTEEGTGVVHTAVVYGEEDYELGMRVGLPVVPLLDEKGIFNEKAPELVRGTYFKDSEKIIKGDLQNRGLLFKREAHTHSYPYCWRCGNMLFYNAIPAWFINVQKIKPQLLDSNNREINWFPEHLKHGRYEKSVEAAPDWNISRNRYWGNPIPVWKCDGCDREEAVGSIEELSKLAGHSKNNYWVMRHGEAESNMFHIVDSGQRKYLHLTPRGQKQVGDSIRNFKSELAKRGQKIDLVISSDITRTEETESIVASVLAGEKVRFDARLEEIHLGPTLTGYRDAEYSTAFPTYRARFEKRPEGGESLRDLRARVWEFLAECERKYEGKNILLVTHEYPTWMLFHVALGWSERDAIVEKEKQKADFIDFAEVRKLEVGIIPRNDGGEADLHRPYIDGITFKCSECGDAMKRTPEIFDSWMEAGSMPFAEYHYPFENKEVFEGRFPCQFVAEYTAQTRAWFYVMHVIAMVLFGKAPFENVVTTGNILAEDGSKMSKSKGNFPDPNLVIGKYGADSLRFYLMNSVVMQADDINFSEKAVENIYRKVVVILWNVCKFFTTYIDPAVLASEKPPSSGGANVLDQWIGIRTAELVEGATEYLSAYDTVRATRVIQEYIDDLSTWYLRRSRKREDAAFYATLYKSLLTASKVIAPFMPFLAEELYGTLRSYSGGREVAESVHLARWPVAEISEGVAERKRLIEAMKEVRRLASVGLAKRAGAGIKIRQPLGKLKIKTAAMPLSAELLRVLAEEVNVEEVVFDKSLEGEIELDLAITPALREKGLLREVARMVQELRQKAGLAPKDKITLMLDLPPVAKAAVLKQEAVLRSAVGAKLVEYGRAERFSAEALAKLEGQEAWIGLRKA